MILMQVENDTANPIYDGRKRHGCESVKTFEKGLRFTLLGQGQLAVNLFSLQHIGSTICADDKLVTALLASAKPTKAETYAEIAATLPTYIAADQVVDRAISQGLISEPQVRTIMAAIIADENATEVPPARAKGMGAKPAAAAA